MRILARLIDFLAALWIIGAAIFLTLFSPFLFDGPEATIWSSLFILLESFFLMAGIPLGWAVLRILQHYRGKKD
ncbi:hypothetical protein A2765_06580 [Candidatus Kaiserbacteria bacterium RIFCSPHIGHO2_01_FULL_56_24]|uniref:DUF5671 domain-containing protein n=1 Tax=Candidatus Kaiserbacteria bacterium RIFCSPHIGHO2_01_FULL_56_24 TaxID=1798487 RepID=A0A1F6DC93_9BACT|nr:MAG: hypothetical protein A2765_06580 [Candidatus Kaiserbacteria bacterium RIFCSPHIGHO2_01_FULL_56_24]